MFVQGDRLHVLGIDPSGNPAMLVLDAAIDEWTTHTEGPMPLVYPVTRSRVTRIPRMRSGVRPIVFGESVSILQENLIHSYTDGEWNVKYDCSDLYFILGYEPQRWVQVGRYIITLPESVTKPSRRVSVGPHLPYSVFDLVTGEWTRWPGMVPRDGWKVDMMVGEDGQGIMYVSKDHDRPCTVYSVCIQPLALYT
ncbi:hypothetical protein KIPB_002866 [Kipferlia bialata]|uniref:Uncharacterized protein n=1 Tax=Kipferlia bialata TaxID=797122 RepID=A0A391NKC3_9EUKA|nr:hypothetical protein KIPB_002866 [Kipferlia bialata]|eukprot:g2866.t1